MKKQLLLLLIAAVLIVSDTQAQFTEYVGLPNTYWDFEVNSARNTLETTVEQTVNSGNVFNGKFGLTTTVSRAAGVGAVYGGAAGSAVSAGYWSNVTADPGINATTYYQFTLNTTGFSGIQITFDEYSGGSITTYPFIGVSYSTNGGASFTSTGILEGDYDTWTYGIWYSLPAAANNNSGLIIRIYGWYGANNASSTIRIDNFCVFASATTVGAGLKPSLNEDNIYTSYTSGGASLYPNDWVRFGTFTINSASTLDLRSLIAVGTPANAGAITVASGGTLDCGSLGSYKITGQYTTPTLSTVILQSGSNIIVRDTNGITTYPTYKGNIQTTTRTYNAGANYTYANPSAGIYAQVTGNGLPTSITGNLTINNTSGITPSVVLTQTTTENAYLYLTTGSFAINGNTLTASGYIQYGTGTLYGSTSSSLYIGGAYSNSVGILNFTAGAQLLNTLTIYRINGGVISNAATLGTNLTTTNLVLTYGVLSTGYNLLTLNAYSGLTPPGGVPWGTNENHFADSYVATCDSLGVPISVANTTTPLTGSYGFQINGIGTGGTTGDVYFPVGASFLPAGTSVTAPTPNRMSINNTGVKDNFNVVVNYGDIDNTPNARVNRIWYVNSANSTATSAPDKASMKLFFVERTTSGWSTSENEVESTPTPFNYTNMALVERDYSATDPNFIAISGGTPLPGDITDYPGGTYNGDEVYAQYTVGTSPDYSGNKNGIYQFNRFSITSPSGIILPITNITLKGYSVGGYNYLDWSNPTPETGIQCYRLEFSDDAENFTDYNCTYPEHYTANNNYNLVDSNPPLQRFYRLKIVAINNSFTYSNIVRLSHGNNSTITVSPNPTTGPITISGLTVGEKLQLISILGIDIQETTTTGETVGLNMAPFARGMYLLRIVDATGSVVFSKKIIKE